jgi:hypothetical protein
MATPSSISSYPVEYLTACEQALLCGSFRIPTENPASARLQFYGLFRALRKAGREAECAGLKLHIEPGYLIIKAPSENPLVQAIRAQAGLRPSDTTSATAEAEAMLERLFSK